MNPYKEDGPRARLSFDRAYCKRCIGPSSVNDGYITGPGSLIEPIPRMRVARAANQPRPPGCDNAPPVCAAGAAVRAAGAAARSGPAAWAGRRRNAIAAIESLVRQRSNGAFIMRV